MIWVYAARSRVLPPASAACPEGNALCVEERPLISWSCLKAEDHSNTRSTSSGEPCCAASQALADAAASNTGQASLIWLTLTTGVIHSLSGCGHIFGILPALSLHRWQLFCGLYCNFLYWLLHWDGCFLRRHISSF
ncbi:hypothetical protein FOZ60_006953 [Perkinsus olseni]|uniref:Uncharacterized protein n=1 Tax=Perkinsus olseni TaxID=32597 RepID=A0A7J6PFB1_PEROL|nr:hypothetical protein FOZ60_006953 [Perkinsus olseni]